MRRSNPVAGPRTKDGKATKGDPKLHLDSGRNIHFFGIRIDPAVTALAALTALYALSVLVPWNPNTSFSARPLDAGWIYAMHLGWLDGRDFGRELTFTYGPYGFIHMGYLPGTYVWVLVIKSAIALSVWFAIWTCARRHTAKAWAAALWTFSLVMISGLIPEIRLYAPLLLLLVYHFYVDDAPLAPARIPLLLSSAILSLAKFSTMVMAVVVVLCIVMQEVTRQGDWRRRFPATGIIFFFAVVSFWLFAGQPVLSFFTFFQRSLWVTSGYGAAMSMTDQPEAMSIVVYLVFAFALFAWVATLTLKEQRIKSLPAIAALSFVLWQSVKAGFVRHDEHELNATVMLAFLSVLFGLVFVAKLARHPYVAFWLTVIAPALLVGALSYQSWMGESVFRSFARHVVSPPRNVSTACTELIGSGAFRKLFETTREENRAKLAPPTELTKGTVDVYPWDIALAVSMKLELSSRPVIQSYSAYTPELLELNAAHLRGPAAPDSILFAILPLGRRYPALEDSTSWPEILCRYDVAGEWRNFAVLHKSSAPRQFNLVPLSSRPAKFGEEIDLPQDVAGPLWATIVTKPTFLGGAVELAYKSPEILLHIKANMQWNAFRFVPGIGEAGFILSPYIGSPGHFAALATAHAEWPDGLRLSTLQSIRLTGGNLPPLLNAKPIEFDVSWAIDPEYEIAFYRLEFVGS